MGPFRILSSPAVHPRVMPRGGTSDGSVMRDPRCKPVSPHWLEASDAGSSEPAAAGRPRETTRSRRDHVQRAPRGLRDASPWTVTSEQLLRWAGAQDWSAETRRTTYASLRGFFAWGVASGRAIVDPASRLPSVKAGVPCPRPAPDDVLRFALVGASPRLRLILRLAAEAGLRRGEIARVHSRDLAQDLIGPSLIVHGKGGKDRMVPLTASLAAELQMACRSGWAFPGELGGHLSPGYVGKLASAALPVGWGLHTLRHRFASRAYDATLDLMSVQEVLGHASVATTQRYVRRSSEALRRVVEAAA